MTDKEVQRRQRKLADTLEGVGDVIVLATKRGKNRTAIDGLEKLEALFEKFLQLKRRDPSKFERLLLSPEFLQRSKENPENTEFLLRFRPDQQLVSLTAILSLLTRVHETAIDAKNSDVSREATYLLVAVLKRLTIEPENGLLAEQLLVRLRDFAYRAIDNRELSMYAAAIHWYTSVVFSGISVERASFDVGYLTLVNSYFFSVIHHIVDTGNLDLFRSLVGHLCDSNVGPKEGATSVFDYYTHLVAGDWRTRSTLQSTVNAETRVARLQHSLEEVYSTRDVEAWLRDFEELKNAVRPYIDHARFTQAQDAEEQVRKEIESHYKYNHLLDLFFQVGAYCLFRDKPEYIREIWQYRQPDDSDATWIGSDIFPRTMTEIISVYLREGVYDRATFGWEDHHGSSVYLMQYVLLLILRHLGGRRCVRSGERIDTPQEAIPADWSASSVYSIVYPIEELLSVAGQFRTRASVFRALDFDVDSLDTIFDKTLIPYLKEVKAEAEKRLDEFERTLPIAPDQIKRFNDRVGQAFTKAAYVRHFLKKFGLYRDELSVSPPADCSPFRIKQIDHKAAFLDSWPVQYSHWGEVYGETLGRDEDREILKTILTRCSLSRDLNQALSCLDQNSRPVILTTDPIPRDWLTKQGRMIWHWEVTSQKVDLPSFMGFYVDGDRHVPVLTSRTGFPPAAVLLLDLNRLGCLHQYSPLEPGTLQDEMHDVCYIRIKAFSEDPALMQQYLDNPPPWLCEQGDGEAQRKHLQKRVEVLVQEAFEFRISEDFVGYRFAGSDKSGIAGSPQED